MIFVTVGTQLSFKRLINAIDVLAPGLGAPVFAQIGRGAPAPANIEHRHILAPADFERTLERCSLVIGHAGIGTLMAAARHHKPMIIFPRRAALGEHRSDHQDETARVFAARHGYYRADCEADLSAHLNRGDLLPATAPVTPSVEDLTDALRLYIGAVPARPGLSGGRPFWRR